MTDNDVQCHTVSGVCIPDAAQGMVGMGLTLKSNESRLAAIEGDSPHAARRLRQCSTDTQPAIGREHCYCAPCFLFLWGD